MVIGEIQDEAGRSVTALALSVIELEKPLQGPAAGRSSAASRPAPSQVFAEQALLTTALGLYKRALRQLQDAAPEASSSPAFEGLHEQLATLRDAHAATHRALVHQWSAQVARDLSLTAEERKGLADVYARSGSTGVKNARGPAGAVPSEIHFHPSPSALPTWGGG